jgi:hypothetical protein
MVPPLRLSPPALSQHRAAGTPSTLLLHLRLARSNAHDDVVGRRGGALIVSADEAAACRIISIGAFEFLGVLLMIRLPKDRNSNVRQP